MKSFASSIRLGSVILAAAFATAFSQSPPATTPLRVALVVGISDYPADGTLADLLNPVNDAKLIATTLEQAGFKVSLATDVTKGQLKSLLDDFVDTIKPGGDAVLYFAGHGMQYEGKNYLLAANAKLTRKYDLGEESLEADTVLDALAEKQPGAALVFLDCCRTPPTKSWLAGNKRTGLPSGLAAIQHTDLLIHYAAAPGHPALDGRGKNSPYAVALAKHLLGGKELAEMLRDVGGEVMKSTSSGQRPYQTGSLLNSFYFKPLSTLAAAAVPAVPVASPAATAVIPLARPATPTASPTSITAASSTPATATRSAPYVNSFGMKFAPAVTYDSGRKVLFSIWETRRQDFAAYAAKNSGVKDSWKRERPDGVPAGKEGAYPVTNITWWDAHTYCIWLTEKEREAGRIGPKDEYRLPTDREWSYAAGIGDREDIDATPQRKHGKNEDEYPWGTVFPPPAASGNYADSSAKGLYGNINGYTDGYATTAPVGQFEPNKLGLYDLGGNVREWCHDAYDANQNTRVLRGSSWNFSYSSTLLSSYRERGDPTQQNNTVGFRCALVLAAP